MASASTLAGGSLVAGELSGNEKFKPAEKPFNLNYAIHD